MSEGGYIRGEGNIGIFGTELHLDFIAVYNKTSVGNGSAVFDDVIARNLQVVDMTASILARDNKMPMWVFDLNEKDSIVNTVNGKFTGTRVIV